MDSSIDSVRAISAPASSTALLTNRQRVEHALAQLPTTTAELRDGESLRALGLEELLAEARRINGVLRNYGVEFEISGDPPQTITHIVDRETGDVIRQVPAQEVLLIAERLEQVRGLLLSDGA